MKFSSADYNFLTELGIDCSGPTRLKNAKTKVVVGMSGGVDSSVAALVTLAQGYETLGVFMKNWEEETPGDDGEEVECSATQDYKDVIAVCELIDIDYYAVNFAKEYYSEVFTSFLEDYKSGRTPNPDILCNSKIKFDVFYKYAKSLGADLLATGHYAQVNENSYLVKGVDQNKDQSYFLYRVPEIIWEDVIFPLGHIEKPAVRKIADHFNLITSKKKDSMGICFIGEKKFQEFLSKYVKEQKGFFKMLNGEVVGEHKGQCFYTIGQRKGLGLGGAGEAWYVVKKDIVNNDVFVERGEHSALFVDSLKANDIVGHQLANVDKLDGITCKVRYRQKDQDCRIVKDGDSLKVDFLQKQRGVAEGQSIVFYKGNICLGGAIIEEVGLSDYDKSLNISKG